MSVTPTPIPSASVVAMRNDLGDLLTGLEGQHGRAVRLAIRREVFGIFDALTARQRPISDTNGSPPEAVAAKLFAEPELRTMETAAGTLPNGIEVNGEDANRI